MSNLTEDFFAIQLERLFPSEESLVNIGLSNSEIYSLKKNYICNRLENTIPVYGSFLHNIFFKYDLSNVQIGPIGFKKEIQNEGRFKCFGMVEIDLLCLDSKTGKIVVLDGDMFHVGVSNILWECALSDMRFFNAILICAEIFSKRIIDSEFYYRGDISTYMKRIESISGGIEFKDFYLMVLS